MAVLARNALSGQGPVQGIGGPRDDRAGGRAGEGSDGGDRGGENGGSGGGGGHGRGGEAWVTVATFSIAAQAHLARLKLEGEDVPCVIVDEHVIATTWVLSPALGGIKLQVPADWLDRAREILGEDAPVMPNGWEAEAGEAARCQSCGKGEYALARPAAWTVVVSILLLGIPLLFLPRVLRCDSCGAAHR